MFRFVGELRRFWGYSTSLTPLILIAQNDCAKVDLISKKEKSINLEIKSYSLRSQTICYTIE